MTMEPSAYGALAAYTFLMTLTPGPTTLMVAMSGARFGFARSVPHMAGALLGYELQLLAVGAGLATALQTMPALGTALHWACALYTLYLGWRMLRIDSPAAGASVPPLRLAEAAALQLLNPKSWFMALATAALFVHPGHAGTPIGAAVLLWAGVGGGAGMCVWAACGTGMRRWLERARCRALFLRGLAIALLLTAGWSLYG
jgi:threonine/homoserine/homoserine lactone efflux protein